MIPPFRRGSGGHNSIFQMLYAARAHRATPCSIWLHDPMGWQRDEWPAVVRGNIREFFAPLEAPVFKGFDALVRRRRRRRHGLADRAPGAAARRRAARAPTSSTTTRTSSTRPRPRAGGRSRPTRYGLHPIAASPWLARPDGQRATARPASQFDFGVDHDVYRPRAGRAPARHDHLLRARRHAAARGPARRAGAAGAAPPAARACGSCCSATSSPIDAPFPLRAPRHRLARAARLGVLGGDRRARASR